MSTGLYSVGLRYPCAEQHVGEEKRNIYLAIRISAKLWDLSR